MDKKELAIGISIIMGSILAVELVDHFVTKKLRKDLVAAITSSEEETEEKDAK